jgi:hypothetical protein
MMFEVTSSTTRNRAAVHRTSDQSGDKKRQDRRDGGADVGHEAQDQRHEAEEERIRHADQPEAKPDRQGVDDVHDQLRKEVGRDARPGFGQKARGGKDVRPADQLHKPVAQGAALQ